MSEIAPVVFILTAIPLKILWTLGVVTIFLWKWNILGAKISLPFTHLVLSIKNIFPDIIRMDVFKEIMLLCTEIQFTFWYFVFKLFWIIDQHDLLYCIWTSFKILHESSYRPAEFKLIKKWLRIVLYFICLHIRS